MNLHIAVCATVGLVMASTSASGTAQSTRTGDPRPGLFGTVGGGLIPSYPRGFRAQPDLITVGGTAGGGVSYRLTDWLSMEAGAGVLIGVQLEEDRTLHTPPLPRPTTPHERVRHSPGGSSFVGEFRLAVMPLREGGRAYRLVGGGAYLANRKSPALIAGFGYQTTRSRRYIVVDLERWWLHVPYARERVIPADDSARIEVLARGRDEFHRWQLRVTYAIPLD